MSDEKLACVLDLAAMVVLFEDGQTLPVTNMLDADGDETEDAIAAVVVVAGPDRQGYWLTITLDPVEETPRYVN